MADDQSRAAAARMEDAAVPAALVTCYSSIAELQLPDIDHGHFIHSPDLVLDHLTEYGPVRLTHDRTGIVFGSDGGGILFAIDQSGQVHRSTTASWFDHFEPEAPTLIQFLEQLHRATAVFTDDTKRHSTDVLMPSSDSGATTSHQYRRSKASTRLRSSRDRRRDIASITASRNSRACHGSPQQAHSVQPPLSYSHDRRFGWWTKLRQRAIADPIEPGHRYFFRRSIRRTSASAGEERPRMAVMSSCTRRPRGNSARTRPGRLRGMGLSVDRHAGHLPICGRNSTRTD
ncbi:hypothetical protein [Streptomyces sp. NPDC049881]|uniref:hypothetical protein n=1 Tax=Streptomyces sp. NPDC049881 TaxID=3155778 RepID=UPI003443AD12